MEVLFLRCIVKAMFQSFEVMHLGTKYSVVKVPLPLRHNACQMAHKDYSDTWNKTLSLVFTVYQILF